MNIYQSLGVRPIINATGTFTRLGGSLMPPEVVQAMSEASRHFVCLEELQHAAGPAVEALDHDATPEMPALSSSAWGRASRAGCRRTG